MTSLSLSAAIDWNNFNSSLLIEVTRPSGVFTCSGVAINQQTVATAAHCLEGEILNIRIFNQMSYNPKAAYWQVEKFELHPDYNSKKSNFKNDIAKIKLKSPLPPSTKFYPIAKKLDSENGNIFRLGFGARTNKNIRTLVTPLFKSLCPVTNILELHDMYSYSGDSGGPVFVQNKGQVYLLAIHSTLSYGPEGKYSFNPLLTNHKSWMEN
ncbi:MAG: serine protease [Bacteriovoracaceae bacterium]